MVTRTLTIGGFSALFFSVSALRGNLSAVLNSLLNIRGKLLHLDELFSFLKKDHYDIHRTKDIPNNDISVKHVSFSYSGTEKYEIDNVTLSIPFGKKIAIVGTNPVSGMTLMTLILSSIILVAAGLKGTAGMVSALIIGGVVCTALSMAGGFITDLKIGYWLGSTPAKQQTWKFLGTLVSAATVGGVILILNQTYGFTTGQLAAPQANAMAAVIEPLMSGSGAPWVLYGIGAVLAIVLNFCKIPALAFALGMFIPMELNTPLLIGGAISWYVGSRSKDQALNTARLEKGTLLASGFIAGGALMGVISAALRFGGINLLNEKWLEGNFAEPLAVVMYIALMAYLAISSLSAKKE